MTTFQLTDVIDGQSAKKGATFPIVFCRMHQQRTDHAVHGNHMHVPCVVVSLMVSVSCKYISFFPLPM